MRWRIRKQKIKHGKWIAEKGIDVKECENPLGIGRVKTAFVPFEVHEFDSHLQAFIYSKRH